MPEHIVWGSLVGSARQGLWRRPGRRLRKTAKPGPGRQQARGARILAPVHRRIETGPGREASGDSGHYGSGDIGPAPVGQ